MRFKRKTGERNDWKIVTEQKKIVIIAKIINYLSFMIGTAENNFYIKAPYGIRAYFM